MPRSHHVRNSFHIELFKPETLRHFASTIAIAAACLAVAPSAALAQSGPSILMGDAETGNQPSTAQDLRAMAEATGPIRIIVGFDVGFMPEGDIGEAAAEVQRGSIASAQDSILSQLATAGNVSRFETIPFMSLTASANDIDRLLNMPGISSIELDIAVPPLLSDSTSLVDAPPLWRQDAGGEGYSVAILDTGVRRNHAAFNNKIVASACFSTTTGGQFPSTTLCPNGQDEHVTAGGPRAGIDCDTMHEGCGHGTHVAGIAAGRIGGNHGMARDADVISLNVFSLFGPAACGAGNTCVLTWNTDQIKALERVMRWRNRFNIAAANMSLGGGQFFGPCDNNAPALTAIIENLRSAGVATVIASGNNGFNSSMGSPACISSAVAVGSTTKQDNISWFSNHAAQIRLMAPGSDILAADADGGRRALTTKSGTSMAAPHVAGAFAMLRSHKPDASVDEIERALVCSGESVSRNNMPKPRISMRAARNYLDNPDTEARWGFGNQRQFNQWMPVRGNWSGESGYMRARANASNPWSIITAPFCANSVNVRARMQLRNPSGGFAAAGVMISSETNSNSDFSGLLFDFGDFAGNFGDTPGQMTVRIMEVSRYSTSSDGGTISTVCFAHNPVPGIGPNDVLNLRVVKRGNDLRFVINGNEVCTGTTNANFKAGHVGVYRYGTGNNQHNLDVFRVQIDDLREPRNLSASSATSDTNLMGGSAGSGQVFKDASFSEAF